MAIDPRHGFLAGGGEMGERIRAMDWSRTPLGPIDGWPQSLRSALSHLLPSKAQIVLFWGPDLITFYNDAYAPVLGSKHPGALGAPVRKVWPEIWEPTLKALFDPVLATGEAFWGQDWPFFIERHGYLEETYFDVSYDPVRDESGNVGGVFCIVSETTRRVVGERRLRLLRDLGGMGQHASNVSAVFVSACEVLTRYAEDLPFCLFYDRARDGRAAELVAACGIEADHPAAPAQIGVTDDRSWPLVSALEILDAADLPWVGLLRAGCWAEPIRQVAVVPCASGGEPPTSWLVAGVSPRRRVVPRLSARGRIHCRGGPGGGPAIRGRASTRPAAGRARSREDHVLQQRQSRVPHAPHADRRAHRRSAAGRGRTAGRRPARAAGDRAPEHAAPAEAGQHAAGFRAHRGRPRSGELRPRGPRRADRRSGVQLPIRGGAGRAAADRRLPIAERGRLRRSRNVGKDRPQPRLERVQVHAGGEHHGPAAPPRRARGAAGHRHRRGHHRVRAAAHLRTLPPRRGDEEPDARGDRDRPRAGARAREDARRRRARPEHRGARQHLRGRRPVRDVASRPRADRSQEHAADHGGRSRRVRGGGAGLAARCAARHPGAGAGATPAARLGG